MLVTYYGHSCFSVKTGSKTLLFDPFITGNPLAKHIDVSKIAADYIFISHGHGDHIEDAAGIAKRTGAKVISNYEIINWIEKQGITNIHHMNIGGHWMFDFGKVKCVTAVHSSSMPDGSYGGNPMGFLIETGEGNFYYSGDTALTYDMKLIGDYKSINFALMPVGGNFTMGIDNALLAAEFINCEKIIGLHYDTFSMIKIDHAEAMDKFTNAGKELHLIEIGKSIEL